MRFKASPPLIAALLQFTRGAVAGQSYEPETRDIALVELNGLQERQTITIDCNRLLEQTVSLLKEYPAYSGKVRAIGEKGGLGGIFAYSVCRAFKVETLDCRYAGNAVASGITLAIVNGWIEGGEDGDEPVEPLPGKPVDASASDNQKATLVSTLEAKIYSKGLTVESISMSPHQRRDGKGGYDVDILGLYDAANDVYIDMYMHKRDDGSGYLSVLPAAARGESQTERVSKAGAKISWVAYNVEGVPEQDAYKTLAQDIADDWATRAHTNKKMHDYIGFIDFDGHGQMQFNISPNGILEDGLPDDVYTCSV